MKREMALLGEERVGVLELIVEVLPCWCTAQIVLKMPSSLK